MSETADTPPLPPLAEMDEEFKAWVDLANRLEELSDIPIDSVVWSPALNAIKFWGEALHRLRLADPKYDAKAYAEAKEAANFEGPVSDG